MRDEQQIIICINQQIIIINISKQRGNLKMPCLFYPHKAVNTVSLWR